MSTPDPQAIRQGLALFAQAQQLHAARSWAPAADAYARALRLLPDHPKLLAAYGQLAEDVGDWQAAERIWRRMMAVAPMANLDAKLGLALYHLGRHGEAIPLLAAYAQRQPGDAALARILATCQFRDGRFADALAVARRAWSLEAHPDAMALMLAVLVELGTEAPLAPLVEEALARYPRDRQIRKLAAEHLLKAGDFARGFPLFADMRVPPGAEPHPLSAVAVPDWDGQAFDGTLLVGAEQGIGDEILVASMYVDLVAMGQACVIEADRRLLPVFARAFPTLAFVARGEGTLARLAVSQPGCRKVISGDLGCFLRRSARDFAGRGAWLRADPAHRDAFRAQYEAAWPGRRRTGISWRSQRVMKSGARKDVPLAAFAPLLEDDRNQCVSLQYGDIADDLVLGALSARLYVDASVDTTADFEALFAQVAALDLVVTSSNVTAHVAGSLGVPCRVLLPRERPVIWYWGYRGDCTPWYPSVRLLRNERDDWTALLAGLAARLRAGEESA